ncbi:hypothetical protein FB45DRAFT_940545 [Roridomyces roridus]|uniref:Uncharacterized protein n=1 Tax=Roridomyces roridus TaxID=1738132 RepID=A0AAD7B6L0_9AGAR|nr:hypothetical protein FB45DRAFT_940545 [Roridomyces roridus]
MGFLWAIKWPWARPSASRVRFSCKGITQFLNTVAINLLSLGLPDGPALAAPSCRHTRDVLVLTALIRPAITPGSISPVRPRPTDRPFPKYSTERHRWPLIYKSPRHLFLVQTTMIGLRSLVVYFTVLLFAFAVASPVTPNDGALVKKALKQFKMKRSETPTVRAPAAPSYVYKRAEAGAPQPSQYALNSLSSSANTSLTVALIFVQALLQEIDLIWISPLRPHLPVPPRPLLPQSPPPRSYPVPTLLLTQPVFFWVIVTYPGVG